MYMVGKVYPIILYLNFLITQCGFPATKKIHNLITFWMGMQANCTALLTPPKFYFLGTYFLVQMTCWDKQLPFRPFALDF